MLISLLHYASDNTNRTSSKMLNGFSHSTKATTLRGSVYHFLHGLTVLGNFLCTCTVSLHLLDFGSHLLIDVFGNEGSVLFHLLFTTSIFNSASRTNQISLVNVQIVNLTAVNRFLTAISSSNSVISTSSCTFAHAISVAISKFLLTKTSIINTFTVRTTAFTATTTIHGIQIDITKIIEYSHAMFILGMKNILPESATSFLKLLGIEVKRISRIEVIKE